MCSEDEFYSEHGAVWHPAAGILSIVDGGTDGDGSVLVVVLDTGAVGV